MGRKQINDEQMPARFPAGTLERMDAVLKERERRSELVRHAVERELRRRERSKSPRKAARG
jgi:metal-responsive CopG/Arc/MetJ family transcriptional regulator